METINAKELQQMLIGIADEHREKAKRFDVLPPALHGSIGTINTILLWVNNYIKDREDTTMEKLKKDLEAKFVSFDDIPQRVRERPVEDTILKYVEELEEGIQLAEKKGKPKPALQITDGIKPQYFATIISRMKKQGKIDKRFSVVIRNGGAQLYLVKKA